MSTPNANMKTGQQNLTDEELAARRASQSGEDQSGISQGQSETINQGYDPQSGSLKQGYGQQGRNQTGQSSHSTSPPGNQISPEDEERNLNPNINQSTGRNTKT